MKNRPVLSICIPTNGVAKWVFPVLDSIYKNQVDYSLYEVIVTDNGSDDDFMKQMEEYVKKVPNLVYERTQAFEFLNEIEAYKRAKGDLIKFINHRTMFMEGSLEYLVNFSVANKEKKPIVYFSNGMLEHIKGIQRFETFDMFVRNLSYWSSWSTGMCFWKTDFEQLPSDVEYNILFPHTTILFNEVDRGKYIIDNTILLDEIPTGTTPKGRYNLFFAFAVEYPSIILDLLRKENISISTFEYVVQKNLNFVSDMYVEYIWLKHECSYDLSNSKKSLSVFYSLHEVYVSAIKTLIKKLVKKVMR